jgi:hypothetical protein
MTEPKATADSVFEIDRIRRLVELMKEHDLSEVDLRESRQRIRICRGPKEPPRGAYGPPPPPPPPGPSHSAAGPPRPPPPGPGPPMGLWLLAPLAESAGGPGTRGPGLGGAAALWDGPGGGGGGGGP